MSLNKTVIDVLKLGLGITDVGVVFDNLDDLIGTCKDAIGIEEVIEAQDKIEQELWH